jgi:hypothetical protein
MTIRDRVKEEITGRSVGAVARVPASAAASRAPTRGASAAITAAAAAVPAAIAPDPDVAERATPLSPVVIRQGGSSRRWLVAALTVLALVLGAGVGSAFTYPIASGAVPGWLGRGATRAQQPTATTTVAQGGPVLAGDLLFTASRCGVMPATITIRNIGNASQAWMSGSPDAANPGFAGAADSTPHATLVGLLDPGSSVTLTVTGLQGAHVVLISDTGTGELAFGAC